MWAGIDLTILSRILTVSCDNRLLSPVWNLDNPTRSPLFSMMRTHCGCSEHGQ